jgi:hypothetical protein
MKPTDEEMARIAAADLAVCEAATPGEWKHDGEGAVYCDHFEQTLADVCWRGHPSEVPQVGKDAEFIAVARTALPAWIRRAQAAEAEVARLREAIRVAGFAVMETSGAWSIHDVSERGKAEEELSLRVATENAELSAEAAQLRASLRRAIACADDCHAVGRRALEVGDELRAALTRQNHEIEQTLGKTLGYPPLYPDASPVDDGQVCVGPHVAETLALEAADRIARLRDRLAAHNGYDRRGPGTPTDGRGFSCRCEWSSASHGDRCPEHGAVGVPIAEYVRKGGDL